LIFRKQKIVNTFTIQAIYLTTEIKECISKKIWNY